MAPAANDPLIGQKLADRFEILSRIGEGGIGVVYKARQIAVDRTIAIKVLGAHVSSDQAWVKRFHNEARAAARLDHPNTVRIIDFGETKDGLLFIAMEYLNGRPLAEEISRLGRLPPVRVLRILTQVCQSLQEAHTQGIIHRDIKPDNIFLVDNKGPGDFVKVLDFSVAKIDQPDAQATRLGTVFGTPAYMSPEQGSAAKLTPQSDIYSCGIVAYEMLTGKPPFESRIPMDVLMMHIRQQPPPLIGFPEPVIKLVMKALEKKPESRQRSAAELEQECQRCLEQLTHREGVASSQALALGASGATAALGASGATAALGASAPPVASTAPPPTAALGAPPPYVPPPQVGQGVDRPVVSQAGAEQKTMLAVAGGGPTPLPPRAGGQNRTMAIGGTDLGVSGGTVLMAEGPPISAQALAVKHNLMNERRAPLIAPPNPLFWIGWALIGIAVGLLLHFLAVRPH